jgi:hypothetical protein
MSYITILQIDKARALEITRKVGRVAWRVAKSAAWVLGNVVGVGLGLMFALTAYGAILLSDGQWLWLAWRVEFQFTPQMARTLALVVGVLALCLIRDCLKDIERWIDATFRAPKES